MPFVMGVPTNFLYMREVLVALGTCIVVHIDTDKVCARTLVERVSDTHWWFSCWTATDGCDGSDGGNDGGCAAQILAPGEIELPGSIKSDTIPGIPEPLVTRLLDHITAFVPAKDSPLLQPVSDSPSSTAVRSSGTGRAAPPFTVVQEWPLHVRAACLEVSVVV